MQWGCFLVLDRSFCDALRMANIIKKVILNGKEVLFEWIPGGHELIGQYSPITQGYGLCVNGNKEVAIVSDDEGKTYYQARFFCRVKRVLPQTIDPAKGKVLMRKFVPLATLNQVLKWGNIADELVRLSMNLAARTAR